MILWTRRPFDERRRAMSSPSKSPRTKPSAASLRTRRRRSRPRPTGRPACWSAASSPRASIGTASPTPTGTAAASAAPSPRPPPTIRGPVNFAFVSCQDVNEGKLNAYRRMIFEDERARAGRPARLRAAPRRLHLRGRRISGRSEDPLRPHHLRCRRAFPTAARSATSIIPLTLDGYRAVYKGYLADPDLQDARARWPFVAIWDNHEFSWQGWQSIEQAGGPPRPGPEHQGRRQPGVVRISSVAREGAERIAGRRSVRPRSRTSKSRNGTRTALATSPTTSSRSTA